MFDGIKFPLIGSGYRSRCNRKQIILLLLGDKEAKQQRRMKNVLTQTQN